jgi:enoyl-CoA hydratase/carnithine racemase
LTDFESIRYETSPPRATITFDRPEVLNAFDFRMLRELAQACEQAANDDDVRAVVLTGAGRAFCVGADLRAWMDAGLVGNEREYWKWFRAMDEAVTAIRKIGKPTVARINGICVGGGNEMQMACDLAVIVEDAFIRHVGLQHGSVPAAGATQWLPLLVGDRRAREIVMLCEEIPARKAEEWGLVNRAVPAAELDATVDDFVAKLADRLPLMTRYAKVQLDYFRDQAWYGTIRHAHDWLALSMLSDEAGEGVRAFLERRKPD